MTHPAQHPKLRLRTRWGAVALAAAATLAGCGGGGDGLPPPTGSCTVRDQQNWLGGYMDDWYFWYAISPNPSPSGFGSVASYFDALLYTGTDASFPADRWSGFESTASFDRYFGDGKTLAYGLRVAGLEVTDMPDQPLYVRYVDPGSPAASAGIVRGDEVLALDGRSAADLIAANDLSALSPDSSSDSLTVRLRKASGATPTITLPAAIYAITPVPQTATTTSLLGRKMGYLVVTDMISQAGAPMSSAFSNFKAAGVQELVIDLRYNGGGLVSVGADLASYAAGNRAAGDVFASLLYNDKRAAANNQAFRFVNFSSALGLARVYVLTGERTCSASEQVVNGLRPFVDVVTIGDTTCGKPVGFLPRSYCDTTYSVVNFESANANNEGRYFDGFNATCSVAEDFTQPMGGANDPLLNAAKTFTDTGACPAALARGSRAQKALALKASERGTRLREPDDRGAMIAR